MRFKLGCHSGKIIFRTGSNRKVSFVFEQINSGCERPQTKDTAQLSDLVRRIITLSTNKLLKNVKCRSFPSLCRFNSLTCLCMISCLANIRMSIRITVCLCHCLLRLPVYVCLVFLLSVSLSVCPAVCLSVCLSVYFSVLLFGYFVYSFCLFVRLSV